MVSSRNPSPEKTNLPSQNASASRKIKKSGSTIRGRGRHSPKTRPSIRRTSLLLLPSPLLPLLTPLPINPNNLPPRLLPTRPHLPPQMHDLAKHQLALRQLGRAVAARPRVRQLVHDRLAGLDKLGEAVRGPVGDEGFVQGGGVLGAGGGGKGEGEGGWGCDGDGAVVVVGVVLEVGGYGVGGCRGERGGEVRGGVFPGVVVELWVWLVGSFKNV